MDEARPSRRSFLLSGSVALTSAWLAANWSGIAAAAEHAAHVATADGPVSFSVLSAADAADVEAITAQVLPSGTTPGAREAHAAHFIDRAMGTFFAERAPGLRAGLKQFQSAHHAAYPQSASFAAASSPEQIAFLRTVEFTPFFEAVRVLTILGTLTASKYGGNHAGLGWKMLGFEDQHVFEAPFGDYEHDYTGFVPYTKGRAS